MITRERGPAKAAPSLSPGHNDDVAFCIEVPPIGKYPIYYPGRNVCFMTLTQEKRSATVGLQCRWLGYTGDG